MIRAIIVDDETPARRLVRSLLSSHQRIRIVDEADSCASAIEVIEGERPDLLFLDVQMPGGSGFDVLAAIGAQAMPMVIFTTAYDRFALDAFRVSACDYLLKPFDEARFDEAVAKVIRRVDGPASVTVDKLRALLVNTSAVRPRQITVKVEGRHLFVDQGNVAWIEANGKEVRLHLIKGAALTVREGLTTLEQRLDPVNFVRVHRSAIVNRYFISEMQPWFRGEYVILLKDGTKLTSGRHFQEAVRLLLQQGD